LHLRSLPSEGNALTRLGHTLVCDTDCRGLAPHTLSGTIRFRNEAGPGRLTILVGSVALDSSVGATHKMRRPVASKPTLGFAPRASSIPMRRSTPELRGQKTDTDGGSCTPLRVLMRDGPPLDVVGEARWGSHPGGHIAGEGVAPPPPPCDRGILLLDQPARLNTPGGSCTPVVSMSGCCSTVELQAYESSWWDSHPRPLVSQTNALTRLRYSSVSRGQDLHLLRRGPQPRAYLVRPPREAIDSGGNAPPSSPYQSDVLTSLLRVGSGLWDLHP
jgi:hypothetical protein